MSHNNNYQPGPGRPPINNNVPQPMHGHQGYPPHQNQNGIQNQGLNQFMPAPESNSVQGSNQVYSGAPRPNPNNYQQPPQYPTNMRPQVYNRPQPVGQHFQQPHGGVYPAPNLSNPNFQMPPPQHFRPQVGAPPIPPNSNITIGTHIQPPNQRFNAMGPPGYAQNSQNRMQQQPTVPFTNEETRQEHYKNKNEKTPAYSTLNLDVLPSPSFVNSLDAYQAKIDPELIKEILRASGVHTADDRVYKVMSAMLEMRLLGIIKEVRIVSGQTNISQPATGQRGADPDILQPKSHLQFEELAKALEELGVSLKRPAFLSEKPHQFQTQTMTSQQLLASAAASSQAQAAQQMEIESGQRAATVDAEMQPPSGQ